MNLPRPNHALQISDQLVVLSSMVKARSTSSLTDANRVLESIMARFLNALYGWNLVNLNSERLNHPSVDLCDRKLRIAIQVTNEESGQKITHTVKNALKHNLHQDFDKIIILFLLGKKPKLPKKLSLPTNGLVIETWDISDLTKNLIDLIDLQALARARAVLDTEIGNNTLHVDQHRDITRISDYAPSELIGREQETRKIQEVWGKFLENDSGRARILTFVALGGEGKTSLVAKWAANCASEGWIGCHYVFAWSFYSQGSQELVADSSDLFLNEALKFFGEAASFADSERGASEKARRLAALVGNGKNLLILDGIEPLQYPPGSPFPGKLRDIGLSTLLKDLATANHSLCVITTRFSISDLRGFRQTTAPEIVLENLSLEGGEQLLRNLGVVGASREISLLVCDVKGHALTLNLIGIFLKRAFNGDVRQRDRVKFEKADEKIDGGRAFRTIAAYEKWLLSSGDEGVREVSVLRVMGLFDRPASIGCIDVLRDKGINGLTDALEGLSDDDWGFCLNSLETAKLIVVSRDKAGLFLSLDAHPHLRAYYQKQLRELEPEVWREANRVLYEHLCEVAPQSTKVAPPNPLLRALGFFSDSQPKLHELQPLYQAVAHACYADLHERAWTEVFLPRILRGSQFYSYQKLGAVSPDLAALACFFEEKWTKVPASASEETRSRVLNATGLRLRMLARLPESLQAHRAAVNISGQMDPITGRRNLAEVLLELGQITEAVTILQSCVRDADCAEDHEKSVSIRTTLGDSLHQAGQLKTAGTCFSEAEQMFNQGGQSKVFIPSLHGFRYCDFLLSDVERAAWRCWLNQVADNQEGSLAETCVEVFKRAEETIKWAEHGRRPMDIALDSLTLGRIEIYRAILVRKCVYKLGSPDRNETELGSDFLLTGERLDTAVDWIYRSGSLDEVPRFLIVRSCYRFLCGRCIGSASAQEDLDEAMDIAERGAMQLQLVDIHLARARLFFRDGTYPWCTNGDESSRGAIDDVVAGERILENCGYQRRRDEVADVKRLICHPT